MIIKCLLTTVPSLTVPTVALTLTRTIAPKLSQKPTLTSTPLPKTLTTSRVRIGTTMRTRKTVTGSPVSPVGVPTKRLGLSPKVLRTGRIVPSSFEWNDVVLWLGVRELTPVLRKTPQTSVLRFSSPSSIKSIRFMISYAKKQLASRHNILTVS